jgi:hypothetical protein
MLALVTLVGVHGTAADEILIASWNLKRLGAATPVAARAEIIALFDLVAVQEVLDPTALDELLCVVECLTGVEWDAVISEKVGEGSAAEHYAFLFRTDRIQYAVGSGGAYAEAHPGEFSREPFFADFKAGAFDFTLVTVHITWGDSARARTAECQRLAAVWDHIQALDPLENDLILVGDFNRDKPTHSAFDPLWDMGLTPVLDARGTRTTFGRTVFGGSFYDNLWIDPEYTAAELTAVFGSGTPLENTLGRGCPQAVESASDHCPVWAAFRTDTDDDPE